MPIATRTFRVFVSSTFDDLIEERDALQRDVFPKLTKICEEHGARFQAIDLRWGVRDEAVLGQKMMEICLAEIERCQHNELKPNFIILLGDRYGNPPLPARIPAHEFETAHSDALVKSWYQRDNNAVPAEYLLKPRTGDFIDKRIWRKVERRRQNALSKAAHAAGLSSDELLKYNGSATRQEIAKGLGRTPEEREHVFAFFRATKPAHEPARLRDLKKSLRKQLGDRVFEYNPGDIAKLCQDVTENLEKVILLEVSRFKSRSALDLEIEAHDAFAEDRVKHFVGRQPALDAIGEHLKSEDHRPLVIHGVSGSGKSALMAYAFRAKGTARRFIGATPESSNGLTLLRSLCQEIARRYGQPEEAPATFNEVAVAFSDRIRCSTPERPLILYIDALDQLGPQDPAATMYWLSAELPPHCKIVLSTTQVPAALKRAKLVEIDPFPENEASDAVNKWLAEGGRKLQDDQRDKLLESFRRCPLPLYLKLAFEEARRWRSFDPLNQCVLGEGLEGIIDRLFDRLSEEPNHGPVLVSHALGYLTAARYGLTEDEILGVLSADKDDNEVWKDFIERAKFKPPEHRLPVIVWSRLHLDLEPYLTERAVPGATTISFYHPALAERVPVCLDAKRRVSSQPFSHYPLAERVSLVSLHHRELAKHFAARSNWLSPERPEASRPNMRKAAELPYHQIHAPLWDELEQTLSDLEFAEVKIAAGMLYDLVRDCDEALSVRDLSAVASMRKALAMSLSTLTQRPRLALQTLYNILVWTQPLPGKLDQALKSAAKSLHVRFWVSAQAPLPVAEARVVFDSYAPLQCLLLESELIAGVSDTGDIEIRDIVRGDLVSRRSLQARPSGPIASEPRGQRIAWRDAFGTIHVEGGTSTWRCGNGERQLVWHPSAGIIAVQEGGDLVAWDPDSNSFTKLALLPEPVSVLKLLPGSEMLLCIAGSAPQNAIAIDVLQRAAPRWIQTSSAPVIDADFDPARGRLLLLTLDARLHVLELDPVRTVEQLAYETEPSSNVKGRPARCAFSGNLNGAFFATDRGQVARWDWASGKVSRLEDYCTVADRRRLAVFQTLPKSGELFLSTGNMAATWSASLVRRLVTRHEGSVSECCFTRSGNVVSANLSEGTLCWSSRDLHKLDQVVYRGVTAFAQGVRPDEILAGDRQGRVWTLAPGEQQSNRGMPIAVVLSEAIRCVFHDGDDQVVVTGKSGRILRVPLFEGTHSCILSKETGDCEQQKILAAGRAGECWSLRRQSAEGGVRTVFCLTSGNAPEVLVLSTTDYFADAAASSDGGSACLVGSSVRVFRRSSTGAEEAYRRKMAGYRVAFLGAEFIAVAISDQPWLEFWRVTEELPTVAAIHLPAQITSLAAVGSNVIAGLSSGALMSLQLQVAESINS